jgi:ribonuclease P protein component
LKKRFPRIWRLSSKKDFENVLSKAKPFGKGNLLIYTILNGRSYSRIGISISKKTAEAVKRNRIKRLIKEVYRINKERIVDGMDIVFVVKPGFNIDNFQSMEVFIMDLLKGGGLIKQN